MLRMQKYQESPRPMSLLWASEALGAVQAEDYWFRESRNFDSSSYR